MGGPLWGPVIEEKQRIVAVEVAYSPGTSCATRPGPSVWSRASGSVACSSGQRFGGGESIFSKPHTKSGRFQNLGGAQL